MELLLTKTELKNLKKLLLLLKFYNSNKIKLKTWKKDGLKIYYGWKCKSKIKLENLFLKSYCNEEEEYKLKIKKQIPCHLNIISLLKSINEIEKLKEYKELKENKHTPFLQINFLKLNLKTNKYKTKF